MLRLHLWLYAFPHAQFSVWAMSSPGHKALALQSPFSHAELYGVEHPICSDSKACPAKLPSTLPGHSGRCKPKASKRKKSTKTVGLTDPGSLPKTKGRKRKSIKVASAPTVLSIRNQTHKVSSPAAFSLAQVDTASPNCSKKTQSIKSSVIREGKQPIRNRAISNSKEPRFRYAQPSRTVSVTTKAQEKAATSCSLMSSVTTKPAATLCPPMSSEKPAATLCPPMSSLLAFSTMSTSEVVLRLGGGVSKEGIEPGLHTGGTRAVRVPAVDIRLKNKPVPSLALPPHMRLHRQSLQTSPQLARKKGVWPLNVEEIGRGLGRLQYRNIIVMSGAGISTTSGIPDFRYM